MPKCQERSDGDGGRVAVAALVLLVVILIFASGGIHRAGGAGRRADEFYPEEILTTGRRADEFYPEDILTTGRSADEFYPEEILTTGRSADEFYPEEILTTGRSGHAGASRLYSSADVDPLITGQLYRHAGNMRNVYAQRTAPGNGWGLVEYSSGGGGPGDVGFDVGPYGLAEYGGRQVGFDDGIPEAWALPSTPVRWYRPEKRDHYGPEGATVYSEGLYSLTEPDHDPLVN